MKEDTPFELRTGDLMPSMLDDLMRMPDNQLAYKKSYFAFIDILGYRSLIDELHEQAPLYIFKIIRDAYLPNKNLYESVKIKVLSDSILVWSVIDAPIGFWNVLNVVNMLRRSFLKSGILIRGGVSFGENFIHNDIIISPVLIKSYLLEQEAVYPRIIIDDLSYMEGTSTLVKNQNGKDGILWKGYFRICEMDNIRADKDSVRVLVPFFIEEGVFCLKHGIPSWYCDGDNYPTTDQIHASKKSGVSALSKIRQDIASAKPKKVNTKAYDKYNYTVFEFNNFIIELGLEETIPPLESLSTS